MQMDKKWAIRLAWMIGGMCAGVLISTNDQELTEMMQMCPECECLEPVEDPPAQSETENTDQASQPVEGSEEALTEPDQAPASEEQNQPE